MATTNSNRAQSRSLKVAVVQPALRLADQAWNLKHIDGLVRAAVREHGPDVVVLPEAYNTPNVYHKVLRTTPVLINGEPYQHLKRMAREHDCWVTGGFVSLRGKVPRHSYVLAEPDGTTYIHDKDEPSVWEYCYYTAGEDDGVFTTPLGQVGVSMGFETGRTRTARRMRAGGVQLILGGDCWPAWPAWPSPAKVLQREQEYYMLWAADTPANLARAVGAPLAVAFHVGPIDFPTQALPGVNYPTIMTGESQIVAADGHVLARQTYDDGEGIIAAVVEIGAPQPTHEICSAFWLRPNTFLLNSFWHWSKFHGRLRYRYDYATRKFPWQGSTYPDLPGYNPGSTKSSADAYGGPGAFNKHKVAKSTRPLAQSLFHRDLSNSVNHDRSPGGPRQR